MKYGQTHAVEHRGRRPAPRRARRLHRLPGTVRPQVHRAAARRGHREPDQERLRGHQRRGNLVDLNGNEIDGDYVADHPGFPGYGSINASQSLAYAADMLESGVPVVDMYISDLHGNEFIKGLSSKGEPCYDAGDALGSGSACYLAQAAYYNQAFGTFFQRLAAEGITPQNTAVRPQLRRGRPRGGRQRGPGDPADPGQLRRRDRALHLPVRKLRRARGQRHRPAERGDRRHHPVRHGVRHRARSTT